MKAQMSPSNPRDAKVCQKCSIRRAYNVGADNGLSSFVQHLMRPIASNHSNWKYGVTSRILTCTELKGHCFVLVSGYVC